MPFLLNLSDSRSFSAVRVIALEYSSTQQGEYTILRVHRRTRAGRIPGKEIFVLEHP